jgi:Ca-activated chloride channel homolog
MSGLKGRLKSSGGPGFFLLVLLAVAVVFFVDPGFAPIVHSAAETQESRPRRSEQPSPGPTATPVAPTSIQTPLSRPTATPTPTPQATPVDRIAPQLGEPPPPPVLRPKPTPTPPEEFGEGEIVRVNTELVTLNVRVIDRNNRPIGNVSQDDFHVFEDGVRQPIEWFSREEVPVSYGVAVDNSGSLRGQIDKVIEAAKTIINSNRLGDETFLIRFIDSEKIELKQDFTSNKDLLMDALDEMFVEGGQTAVIDAVYLAAEHAAEYKKGDDMDRRRRALILVTDGEDRASTYRPEQLFASLREEDVQIYVIGFVNELDRENGLIRKGPHDKAVSLINKLASETGGRAFFPQSISELPQIANEIVRDLRTQYVVAYNPTNKARDGSYRAIKVAVDQGSSSEKRIALTRSGRVAPRESGRPPKPPAIRTTSKPVAGVKKSP